jgi:hypothetical protein
MAYKKGEDRYQRVLFPDCVDDYVEGDAPVRLFDAFVESLDMENSALSAVLPWERDALVMTHATYLTHIAVPTHPNVKIRLKMG